MTKYKFPFFFYFIRELNPTLVHIPAKVWDMLIHECFHLHCTGYCCIYMHIQCPRMYIYIYGLCICYMYTFFFSRTKRGGCIASVCVCMFACLAVCRCMYVYMERQRVFFFFFKFFFPLPSPISHIYIRYPILPTLFILERKLYTLKSQSLHAKTNP